MRRKAKNKNGVTIAFMILVAVIFIVSKMSSENINYDDSKSEEKTTKLMDWPIMLAEDDTGSVATNLTAKNFYVIMDGSGSMSDTKCAEGDTKEDVAKKALIKFADKVPGDANLGLITFDGEGIRELVPIGLGNRDAFKSYVQRSSAGGTTPLKSAMQKGVRKLSIQAGKQLGYGEYNLVVVTDGEADNGENPKVVVDYVLGFTPVIVHTVGFCISESHSLNRPGDVLYKAANRPEELFKGLEEVLAEASEFNATEFKEGGL